MTVYHLTDNGPMKCSASIGSCPYSGSEHYDDVDTARNAYEALMTAEHGTTKTVSKNGSVSETTNQRDNIGLRKVSLLKTSDKFSNFAEKLRGTRGEMTRLRRKAQVAGLVLATGSVLAACGTAPKNYDSAEPVDYGEASTLTEKAIEHYESGREFVEEQMEEHDVENRARDAANTAKNYIEEKIDDWDISLPEINTGDDSAPVPASAAPAGVILTNGPGFDSNGLYGVVSAPGSCHFAFTSSGQPLPDPTCTPGAIDVNITQENLPETICREGGYTASVRPPAHMTQKIEEELLTAYGIPVTDAGLYKVDHLIPLAAGGSNDIGNLWPAPYDENYGTGSSFVQIEKDRWEHTARNKLCSGDDQLASVQNAFATDWTVLMERYG